MLFLFIFNYDFLIGARNTETPALSDPSQSPYVLYVKSLFASHFCDGRYFHPHYGGVTSYD
jgi:hypothetical protein